MKNKNNIIAKILFASIAATAFVNCGQNHSSAPSTDKLGANATVRSTVLLGKVGTLSKGSAISLSKLILTAVSSATPADTVRDTSNVSGNTEVTVLRVLTLAPLRNWTITAKSLDAKDSIIHSGVTSAFFVKPADTASVTLNLTSRFSMYEANFNALPDSISSSVSGTGKDKLNLNRVVLKVDGVIKADSLLASGYFAGGQNVNVYFDYITTGSHTVTLEAYGVLHNYAGILYTGSSTFTAVTGVDDTKSISLNWVGPTTGTGKLTVTLGKVGKVTVNGALPGSVIP